MHAKTLDETFPLGYNSIRRNILQPGQLLYPVYFCEEEDR